MFKITHPKGLPWTETELYSFSGKNGNNPLGPLLIDKAGNLYGPTLLGGKVSAKCTIGSCGTVFKLTP